MTIEIEKAVEAILKVIRESELDCSAWDETCQQELASEILLALQDVGVKLWSS